jgi:hypothetical protein
MAPMMARRVGSPSPVRAQNAAAPGIAALLVFIVLSSMNMSLGARLLATVDTGWGVTTMVDLYLSLFAMTQGFSS